ncbi:GNAT family N-acetyltransferase [Brevibacterium oceani]|uniref:GNAT family N-acetyltransferase n=1 Tax=Brevibacterium oceani TaxID=358099 RepID=UPI0015E6B7BD|nr:GNAT family N-acetyltransferase [Brevibacterium oceani]
MTLPPWPSRPPAHGSVFLREVGPEDVGMARELSTDPYVPQTGSLPFNASIDDARAWITRQQGRHPEGVGFSFAIATGTSGRAVGHCGLWLSDLDAGLATAGYAIVPSQRRRGYATDALLALTAFGWTMPDLTRIVLHIEPWNTASQRTAERAKYVRHEATADHRIFNGETREMLVYVASKQAA